MELKEKNNEFLEKDYFGDLQKIKETIRRNQNKAMVYVNSQMILTYYEIGTIINSRKIWGSKYVQNLANDLKEYGKSYSSRNLHYMAKLSSEFSRDEIMQQLVAQIPWGTLATVIMQKSKSHEEMLWYINQTHKNGWSRSVVLNKIAMKAYERSLIEPSTTSIVKSDILTKELFKDSYVFDFIDKEKVHSEKDLKEQMIDNIIQLLKEMGNGFALIDKEYKIEISGDEFFIDILMYNVKIHSYVVIEVKIGKFHPSDLGQLLFYVNAIDELEKTNEDNNTIGLLLCKEANNDTCRITLKNVNIPLGISKYKFIDEIEEYLDKRLKK